MANWAEYYNTWEEFCHSVGIDTPAQLEAEAQEEFEENCISTQDAMEARGGPVFLSLDDDILF